jgi:hypothetical protein
LDDITAGVGATGRLVYNEWTGITWQLTTMTNNYYCICNIFAVNAYDDGYKIIAFVPQNQYSSINDVRAAVATEIANALSRFVVYEVVPLASVIFQTNDGYANSVKARIRVDSEGNDYVDWRTSELAQGSNPTSHANLTNVLLAGTGVTQGHIDDQAQTIYGVKTLNSFAVTPSSAPTTDYQVANKKYVDDEVSDLIIPIGIACSDEVTDLTVDTAVTTFRMPLAMTLTAVKASVTTAPTGADLIIDINEGGVSILSTEITIDAGEKTSATSATPPVISDTALAEDSEITIDVDQVGSTVAGAGLKIWLIGKRA